MNTTHVKLSPAVLLAFVLLLCNLSAIARPQEKICLLYTSDAADEEKRDIPILQRKRR